MLLQTIAERTFFTFWMIFGLSAYLSAASKPVAMVAEPVKEFGVVPVGKEIAGEFFIRNGGTADLKITDVQPSCGCVVADFDKIIRPGGVGKVRVVLDSSTFSGPISKEVVVFTNDSDHPQIELTVRAKVEPYIVVKPGYARYVIVQGETQKATSLQSLWASDGTSWDITSADSPYPYLTITYREAKPEERMPEIQGKQWRVEIELSNQANVGPLTDSVVLHTNHPKQSVVKIPVSGFVRPRER